MKLPALISPHRTSLWQACFALLLGGLFFGLLQWAGPPIQPKAPSGHDVPWEASTTETLPALRQQDRHLAAAGIDRWHQQGIRGQKIRIAILDSGFQGYQSQLGKALPAQVTARSFRVDGRLDYQNSQHGLLCAEVVHTVAPEAELLFSNWEPNDPQSFLQAVRWAREQGAKIISCSLIMPSWSDGEGGGVINQAVAEIVGQGNQAGDLLFFASAGNTAQRHWCGEICEDHLGYHQWAQGDIDNLLTPWGNERVAVELYGPTAGDYDLLVLDPLTGQSVGQQQARLLGDKSGKVNCLLVRFMPEPGRVYQVRLRSKKQLSAKQRGKNHLVALGGNLSYFCNYGSITCPADGPGVCAIGAVDADGQRWHYSSCGPNSALPKPDYVAVVPFPSVFRPHQPFSGTSAAAPQAAGIAALWWCKHPDWTANQVKDALRQHALDLGPAGHDYETGYGLVRMP